MYKEGMVSYDKVTYTMDYSHGSWKRRSASLMYHHLKHFVYRHIHLHVHL